MQYVKSKHLASHSLKHGDNVMRMAPINARALLVLGLIVTLPGTAHSQAVNYSYDSLGRIVAVTYPDGKQIVYTYDAAGNRTQHIVSASTVNRPPVAIDDAKTATEGVPYAFDPRTNDSDPDGHPLTVTNVSSAELGNAVVSGGGTSITYTPTLGRSASDLLTYSISDGNGMSASAIVTMTIANGPPTPVADAIAINQIYPIPGYSFDPRVNDSDPGQDPFTVTATTNGTKGTTSVGTDGASVRYLPNAGQLGSDSFTYTITDDANASAVGTVNVTINVTQQPPVANTDSMYYQTPPNVYYFPMFSMDPRWNDTDPEGQSLLVSATTNGTYGTASVGANGTKVQYLRTSNFPTTFQPIKTDTFTYTISDGYGGTAVATVNVTVRYIFGGGGGGCGGSPCP